jgi:hypothetical protein
MLHTKQSVQTNHSVEFFATSNQSLCNKSRLTASQETSHCEKKETEYRHDSCSQLATVHDHPALRYRCEIEVCDTEQALSRNMSNSALLLSAPPANHTIMCHKA